MEKAWKPCLKNITSDPTYLIQASYILAGSIVNLVAQTNKKVGWLRKLLIPNLKYISKITNTYFSDNLENEMPGCPYHLSFNVNQPKVAPVSHNKHINGNRKVVFL